MTLMAPEKKWLIPELHWMQFELRNETQRRFRDIERRLELGIYATAEDETMDDIATKLRALQESENPSMMDFVQMDIYVNELLKRGWFQGQMTLLQTTSPLEFLTALKVGSVVATSDVRRNIRLVKVERLTDKQIVVDGTKYWRDNGIMVGNHIPVGRTRAGFLSVPKLLDPESTLVKYALRDQAHAALGKRVHVQASAFEMSGNIEDWEALNIMVQRWKPTD